MARTYLSILTEDLSLEESFIHAGLLTKYRLGFCGNNEDDLISFLKTETFANHILFVKPTPRYLHAYNESDLRVFAKIDVIIIGPPLSLTQIGIVQSGKISGYILAHELTDQTILHIMDSLYQKGYYPNNQIPEEYWLNRPKQLQRLPKPKFTKREKEVLIWMCHGYSLEEIAEFIDTGSSNVRNYVIRLQNKAFVDSSICLVVLAVTNKWVIIRSEKFKQKSPFLRNIS